MRRQPSLNYDDEFPKKLRELLGDEWGAYGRMADALGVANSTVTHWSTGYVKPSRERVNQIAAFFGINPKELTDCLSGIRPARRTRHEKAVQMLDQLEDLLLKCEEADQTRIPTMKAFLMVARINYFLLERWVKEHDQAP